MRCSPSKMTAKERLKEGIRAWGRAPRGLTWSFWFLMVIYGLFLAGICSDHWLESSIVLYGNGHRNQGLWRFCYETLGTTCCGYINDVMYIERKSCNKLDAVLGYSQEQMYILRMNTELCMTIILRLREHSIF